MLYHFSANKGLCVIFVTKCITFYLKMNQMRLADGPLKVNKYRLNYVDE